MFLFVLSFFPRDVLDEIWDLIESVSEGFPTYSDAKWTEWKAEKFSNFMIQIHGGSI